MVDNINNSNTNNSSPKLAEKLIKNVDILEKFLKGKTFTKIMDFILALQDSVKSSNPKETVLPEKLKPLSNLLDRLEELLKETPPLEDPQRFGNKAFRLWYEKLEQQYDDLMCKIVDPTLAIELKAYFLDCFGSAKRIDYGTGHELNFLCILLILYEHKYIEEGDFKAIVHCIFYKYIYLVRNIQISYRLEPAGAHGVWGLDEYHFLPFLFGASELIDHPDIEPSSIHSEKILDMYSDTYMYLSCIKYITIVRLNIYFLG
jgi:serine/threonine-protein phosphatase 2A activator